MAAEQPLLLLVLGINVVVLGYAALCYVRRRDALYLFVAAMFVPPALVFASQVAERVGVPPSALAANVVAALYLTRPYVTLRVAGGLGRPRRLLPAAALVTCAAMAVPTLLAPRPFPADLSAWYALVYGGWEAVAAVAFGRAAADRAGSVATRLRLAAYATWCQVGVVAVPALGGLLGTAGDDGRNFVVGTSAVGVLLSYTHLLLVALSAVGYAAALLPPRWLRRLWAAEAAHLVSRRVLAAPDTETPAGVWRRYAAAVRDVSGADGVTVVVAEGDRLAQVAQVGAALPAGVDGDPAALAAAAAGAGRLVAVPRPARGAGPRRTVCVVALSETGDRAGALVTVQRRHGLFDLDELRQLGLLGVQARVLAERSATLARDRRLAADRKVALAQREVALAEQRRLSTELSGTVRALADSVHALTDSHEAKSRFLAAMSHELRTPLNAIIGFSDLMRGERPEGRLRRVPAEWADYIHDSGCHLLGLINDLLDLAKVEAGRFDLRRQPTRLDTAVGQLVAGLRPTFAHAHLTVTVRLPELTADVDPVRFRQVLENLLTNAVKFTPPGGQVVVEGHATGPDVLISVADTGVGISEVDQDRVFAEFTQVGDADGRPAGTGLGLSLVRQIARAHGGDVTLRSVPGAGSVFTVRLPRAAAGRSPAPPVSVLT